MNIQDPAPLGLTQQPPEFTFHPTVHQLPPAVFQQALQQVSEACGGGGAVNVLSPFSDPLFIDANRRTPLMLACQSGALEAARLLLPYSDVNQCDRNSTNALFFALESQNRSLVDLILSAGPDLYTCNQYGQNALIQAAKQGAAPILQILLPYFQDQLNAVDEKAHTALMGACQASSYPCAQLLVDAGANPCSFDSNGQNALFFAAYLGCTDLLQLLAPLSNLNHENRQGNTALHLAAKNGHASCIPLLITSKNVRHFNLKQRTPLMLASESGHAAVVRMLRPYSDLHQTNNDSWTPLMLAAKCGHIECVQELLTPETIQAVDLNNDHSAHIARDYGHEAIGRLIDTYRTSLSEADNLRQSLSKSNAKKPASFL